MLRNVNYIIKRILIGTGIALLLMLIKGNLLIGVSARTISMDVPDNFGYYTTNGQNTQITLTSQQATLNNYVNIPSYRSQLIPQNSHGGLAYEWVNANLCFNDDLTISGVVHNPTITSVTWASGYFNSWTEQKSCDMFAVSNGYRFTCSGTGGGGFVVYFGFQNDNSYGGYMYLERDMDIYCNATANDIISNANNNTTQIINNNNENTQNIINNQNENTEREIESQKVCSMIDKVHIKYTNKYLGSSAIEYDTVSANELGITDYIPISSSDSLTALSGISYNSSSRYCFYNVNKSFISCFVNSDLSIGTNISIPINASYVRFTISALRNEPSFRLCRNGNQAIADGQHQINDTLNNDDITGATSEAESFFDNFTSDSHGLSGIITAPLRLIQSLSTSTCSSLTIPLPFVQTNATLPCMSTIYSTYFPTFLTLYQLITTGLIGYWVLIKLFGHVKGMQDPKDDRIEVLDL